MPVNPELNIRLNLFANTNQAIPQIAGVQASVLALDQTIRTFNLTTAARLATVVPPNLNRAVTQLNQSIVTTASNVLQLTNPINALDRILSGTQGSFLTALGETVFTSMNEEMDRSIKDFRSLNLVVQDLGETFISFAAADNTKYQMSSRLFSVAEGLSLLSGSFGPWTSLLSLNTILGSSNMFLDNFNFSVVKAGRNLSEYATKSLPNLANFTRTASARIPAIQSARARVMSEPLAIQAQSELQNLIKIITPFLGDTPAQVQKITSTVATESFNQYFTPYLQQRIIPVVGNILNKEIDLVTSLTSKRFKKIVLDSTAADISMDSYISKISRKRIPNAISDLSNIFTKGLKDIAYAVAPQQSAKMLPDLVFDNVRDITKSYLGGIVRGQVNAKIATIPAPVKQLYKTTKALLPKEVLEIEAKIFDAVYGNFSALLDKNTWLNFANFLQNPSFIPGGNTGNFFARLATNLKQSISTFFINLFQQIKTSIQSNISSFWTQITSTLPNSIGGSLASVSGIIQSQSTSLALGVSTLFRNIPTIAENMFLRIKNIFPGVYGAIANIFTQLRFRIFPNISKVLTNVVLELNFRWLEIQQRLSSLFGGANNIIQGIIQPFNNIKSRIESFFGRGSNIASVAVATTGGTSPLFANIIRIFNNIKAGLGAVLEKALKSQYEMEVSRISDILNDKKAINLVQQSLQASGKSKDYQALADTEKAKLPTVQNPLEANIIKTKIQELEQQTEYYRKISQSLFKQSQMMVASPAQKKILSQELQKIEQQKKEDEKKIEELNKKKEEVKASPLNLNDKRKEIFLINAEIYKIADRYQNMFQQIQSRIKLTADKDLTSEASSKLYKELDKIFGGGMSGFLSQLGKNAATGFVRGLIIGSIDILGSQIGKIDQVVSRIAFAFKFLPDMIVQPLSAASKAFSNLAIETTGIKPLRSIYNGFNLLSQSLTVVTQQISVFNSAFQGLFALAKNNPISMMLRQADAFKQQLITLQSSVAATNQIKIEGQVITDPTQSIVKLEQPIQQAVDKLRKGSLELSGITSQQLVDPFIIMSGQIGRLGISLSEASDLTLSFASAITSLKIPSEQFAQEIRSIVTGQITSDSMVAKTLGITNQMIGRWRSQGVVFDELTKRLAVFRAGQSLTAKTLEGLQSNIMEVFEEASRIAGGKLLGPVTENLQQLYDFILGNKDALDDYLGSLVEIIIQIGGAIKQGATTIFNTLVKIGSKLPEVALNTVLEGVKAFTEAVVFATDMLAPFIAILATMASGVVSLGSPFLKLAIQFKVLEVGARSLITGFSGITQAIPIVGGLMTALSVRGLPAINMFANLYDKVGLGSAGFLVLGKNMKAIPGLSDAITRGLGKNLGPLAAVFTGVIPLLSTIGIQAASLAKVVPFMSAGLAGVLKLAPSAITGIGLRLAALPIFAGNSQQVTAFFQQIVTGLTQVTGATDISLEISKLFQRTVSDIGSQFKVFVAQTALLGAGFLVLTSAIDQLILKNQAALDILKPTLSVLINIPRILIQETIPALAKIPHLITAIGVAIVATTILVVGFQTSLATLNTITATVSNGSLTYIVGRMNHLGGAIIGVSTSIQQLIATSLVPMAGQIGITGDALTAMANKATAAATAQATASVATATAAGKATKTVAELTEAAIVGNFRMSGAFLMTTKQAAQLGASLTTLSATLTAFGAGAVGLDAVMKGLMGTMKLALIPIASVTALIGVVMVGAIAAAAIRMDYLQKEMADWNEQTNTMLDTSAKIERLMIKNAKAQEQRTKYGIALTEEEYTKNKRVRELAIKDIEAMQRQITDLRASKDFTGLNSAEIDNQVQILEDQIKKLQSRTENIQISTKPLQELGGTLVQLASKSELALQGITNASGDSEAFKQAAEALTKLTQQEYELGAVSEQVAAERLESLINNTKLDVDLRVSAEQALQKIRETSTQKRIEEEKKAQQKIQSLADEGKLSEAKASQETLNLRLKEIEIQLSAEKKAHEERMRMRKAELAYEWEKVNSEIEAKERTLKYDSAKDSTGAKTDLTQQQQKLAEIKAQLDAGSRKIEEFQSKGGAATAEEQTQLQLLKAQQKSLEAQQSSYVDLIKYLESTIARLDLKQQAPEQLEKIAQSLQGVDAEIKDAETRLQGLTGKGQKAEKADVQVKLDELKARQKGLLAEQAKYNNSSQEMNDEAKQKLSEQLKGLKAEQENIEKSGNSVLQEEQRKHNNKLAELEAERAKTEKEKREKEKQERLKDFDEQLKISEAARATGLKDEQQAAIDAQKINEGKVKEEMKQLAERKAKLTEEAKKQGKTLKEYDKEASEEIETQEAEHQQKLTEIRKQAFQRRMSDLKEDLSEQQAVIEASQETGKIDNQQAAKQSLDATRKNAQKQLQLIDEQLKQLKKTDIEGREELLKQKAEIEKQLAQAEKKATKDRIADAEQDTDERLTKIELSEKKGADKQVTIQQSLVEKTKGINEQLAIIQEAKKTARGEYLEELIAQEQKLQGKLIDAEREAMEQRLADLREDSEEEQAIIDQKESAGGDKTKLAAEGLVSKEKSIKQQLTLIRQAMLTASGEALERLKAQEAKLLKEMNDSRRAALDKQLADIKEDSEERLATIEKEESDGADKRESALKSYKEREREINESLAVIRKEMLTATGENLERLKALEQKKLKELNDARKQLLEQQIADIKEDAEEKIALIEKEESEGADKQGIIAKVRVVKETEIADQLALIRAEMLTAQGENLEALKAKEAKLLKELNDMRRQMAEQALADLKEDLDERLSAIELAEARGLDRQKLIGQRLGEQQKSIAAQLAIVQEQMKTATGENLERLQAQENKLNKDLVESRKQALEQRLNDIKEDGDEQSTILESQFINDQITESEYYQKRLEVTLSFFDKQLQLIKAAQANLGADQIEEQERLAVQEAQIMKGREAAISEFQDQQLQLLDRKQKEATQTIELAEIERNKQLQQALNDGLMTQAEVDAAKLNSTKQRIDSELSLEMEKLNFLKSQPAFNDPRKEEERQSKIRESQKRTAQLQLQLLEQQKQEQEALLKQVLDAIDKQVAQIQNSATAVQQKLEIELKQQDYLTKALDNQNRILQARQGLQGALGQFIDNEFKIMEATATTEKERQRVAKLQTNYKLQALYTEQQTQRQMLEIDIKRNEIAQKRAEMENQIAQIKAGADVAKAQAELAKVKSDPKAKPEQLEAARLGVEASLATLAGAMAEGQSLIQQRGIMEEENAMKRQTQSIQQQTQLRGAELERIQAIANPRRKKLELKALSGQITPQELSRLDQMRKDERDRQELEKITQQQRGVGQGYGLTSEGVINLARNQQIQLREEDLLQKETPVINLEGIMQSLSANLSTNMVGAIGEGNSLLSSIASQLGNILGVIKNLPANTGKGTTTVNNIGVGPTPGQVRGIANQESLKTIQNVLRSASFG